MLQKIKTLILQSSVAALLLVPAFAGVAGAQNADIENNLCKGAADLQFKNGTNSNECADTGGDTAGRVDSLVAQIINVFSVIVGIVAVIMIIIGGFRYIVSGGDSGKVGDAKNTILYALIGLVIVAFAQFVVKFVLAKATGN